MGICSRIVHAEMPCYLVRVPAVVQGELYCCHLKTVSVDLNVMAEP